MRFLISTVLSLGCFFTSVSQSEILPAAQQIGPHSWAWIGPYGAPSKENQGFRMNLGFVIGTEAVAIIDSGYSDAMAKEMLQQIRALSKATRLYVINTNSQPHRILGNGYFHQQGAQIIAAEGALTRISSDGKAMATRAQEILGLADGAVQTPAKPDQLIATRTSLDLGKVNINLIPVPHAHTAGGMVVQVIEDDVVYSGDVLYGGRLLAILPISRVDGWLQAYALMEPFDTAIMVPGHGTPGKLETFTHSTQAYLQTLKDHMDVAVEQGMDMQAAINGLDQTPWKALADFDELAGRNAHQTYTERELAAFE